MRQLPPLLGTYAAHLLTQAAQSVRPGPREPRRVARWRLRVGPYEVLLYNSGRSRRLAPYLSLSQQRIFSHRSNILCYASSSRAGNKSFSALTRVVLCRFVDIDFREFTFYDVG